MSFYTNANPNLLMTCEVYLYRQVCTMSPWGTLYLMIFIFVCVFMILNRIETVKDENG